VIFEPIAKLSIVVRRQRAHAAALERIILHHHQRDILRRRAPVAAPRRGLRAQIAALDLAVKRVEVQVRVDRGRRSGDVATRGDAEE
jgi:hypothetical protein